MCFRLDNCFGSREADDFGSARSSSSPKPRGGGGGRRRKQEAGTGYSAGHEAWRKTHHHDHAPSADDGHDHSHGHVYGYPAARDGAYLAAGDEPSKPAARNTNKVGDDRFDGYKTDTESAARCPPTAAAAALVRYY